MTVLILAYHTIYINIEGKMKRTLIRESKVLERLSEKGLEAICALSLKWQILMQHAWNRDLPCLANGVKWSSLPPHFADPSHAFDAQQPTVDDVLSTAAVRRCHDRSMGLRQQTYPLRSV